MRALIRLAVHLGADIGRVTALLLCLVLTGFSSLSWAQVAGEVKFLRGVGFAETPGQLPRALGRGQTLNEGDRLTTADGSMAIIALKDGTSMTLRPNTEMIVQKYQFNNVASEDSMVMQLLRGGFRAVTGLIAKGSANAAKIQTATATIGIRGTDFDARLCDQDCKAESSRVQEKPVPNAVMASAKLVLAQGEIHAVDAASGRRRLVEGASVYVGDRVETGPDAKAVLAFRDESRLTLGGNTRFRVENFVFDDKNPADGRFFVSLLTGTMRALTGLVAKAGNRNVRFSTATATIGIRGTGLDMDCADSDSCSFFTWLGSIEVTPEGQTAFQTLQAGQGLFVSRTEIRPLFAPTLDNLPRPDAVPVNIEQLFSGGQGVTADEPGLFVFVRDGHVEVMSATETLHLGRGETGFAGSDGRTGRPAFTPLFIQFDRVPLPNSSNPAVIGLITQLSQRPGNLCR